MNSRKSKKSDPRILLLKHLNKVILKISDKYVAGLTWNEEFELPDGSHSVLDIQE